MRGFNNELEHDPMDFKAIIVGLLLIGIGVWIGAKHPNWITTATAGTVSVS